MSSPRFTDEVTAAAQSTCGGGARSTHEAGAQEWAALRPLYSALLLPTPHLGGGAGGVPRFAPHAFPTWLSIHSLVRLFKEQ